jgi:hypothetical protein
MTVTRTYHSPARQARRQHTRQAIIEAFIAQLGDPGRAASSWAWARIVSWASSSRDSAAGPDRTDGLGGLPR